MTATAFLLCLYLAKFIIKNRNMYYKKEIEISDEDISNFGMIIIVAGLIGARAWFVILNSAYFIQYPLESFQIWLGGQSIQGGIVGACLGTFLFEIFSNEKLSFAEKFSKYLKKLSVAAVLAPLGQAIGRWGNFFNEEAYGSVTDLPWKLFISHTGNYHHPTFLYESIWNLAVFGILLFLSKKLPSLKIIGAYLFLYSFGRFFIEALRTDSLYLGSWPAATIMSIVGMTIGTVLFRIKHY